MATTGEGPARLCSNPRMEQPAPYSYLQALTPLHKGEPGPGLRDTQLQITGWNTNQASRGCRL